MLCRTYEPPVEQKIDALLALTNIGDEWPLEFALELQRLASDASVDDFFKCIFVHCLPAPIITAITGSLAGKLQAVTFAADRAWTAAATSSGQAVKVAAVSTPASSRGGRCRGKRGGTRNNGGQMTTLTLCSFHKKFGDGARKCASGCSHWNEYRPHEAQVFQVEVALEGEDADVGSTASGNA